MTQNRSTQDKGLKFIGRKKVVTLVELALHLQCSPRTVQRRLADWKAINSYNRNGSYYTLADIAKKQKLSVEPETIQNLSGKVRISTCPNEINWACSRPRPSRNSWGGD